MARRLPQNEKRALLAAHAARMSCRASDCEVVRPGLRPVDVLGQIAWTEVDQAAALDGAILTAGERESVNGALCGIDDQHLVHLVGGVEGELLPALVARRDDLHNERGGRMPQLAGARAMQPAVGHAEVLFGVAQIEPVHGLPLSSAIAPKGTRCS